MRGQDARRRRWRFGLSLVPALLLVLAVVGTVGATASQGATVTVEMGDNFFRPAALTVNVGDTVVWTHTGREPHDVTSTDGGPLDSPRNLLNGATYAFTATTAGTFAYECTIHEGQDGVLVVQAASAAPPTTPSAAPRAGLGALAGGPMSAWALVLGLGLLLGAGLLTRGGARRSS